MKKLARFLPIFCLILLLTASGGFADIGPVKQLTPGVYSAQGKTPDGETIYFGLERVDNDTAARKAWQEYLDAMSKLTNDYKGWLTDLGEKITDPEALAQLHKEKPFADLSPSDFDDLVFAMISREIYPKGKRWDAFNGIRAGMAGVWLDEVTFIAYISKEPIKGKVFQPHSAPATFSEVNKAYGHILMTVSVTLSKNDSLPLYEDRGIFRNPLSMIEGKHRNIANTLHVFAAKALESGAGKNIPGGDVEYMFVRPLAGMKRILEDQIGTDNIIYKDGIKEMFPSFDPMLGLAGGFGALDTPMLISVDHLLALDTSDAPAPKPPQSNVKTKRDNAKDLRKRIQARIKAKDKVQISLAPAAKSDAKILVQFKKKSDAEALVKLFAKSKHAPTIVKSSGKYSVTLGPDQLAKFYKENTDIMYALIVSEFE